MWLARVLASLGRLNTPSGLLRDPSVPCALFVLCTVLGSWRRFGGRFSRARVDQAASSSVAVAVSGVAIPVTRSLCVARLAEAGPEGVAVIGVRDRASEQEGTRNDPNERGVGHGYQSMKNPRRWGHLTIKRSGRTSWPFSTCAGRPRARSSRRTRSLQRSSHSAHTSHSTLGTAW